MTNQNADIRTFGFIPVEAIRPNPENPRGPNVRDNDKEFESLRESVAAYGVLVPLVVEDLKDGTFRLVDGERRYHVAGSLRLSQVPAIILPSSLESDAVRRTMFQIHSNRSPWSAAMQCRALEGTYRVLSETYPGSERAVIEAIVEETGLDSRTARNRVQFLRWPRDIKDGVYSGEYANAYWYIVEIEDKIVEPARRTFPEYFEVVAPAEVRRMLFDKFSKGLVRAAVQVRRAAVVAGTPPDPERQAEAEAVFDRLVREPTYSFEEAYTDYRSTFPEIEEEPPPSARVVLNQVRKLLTILDSFGPGEFTTAIGASKVDLEEIGRDLDALSQAAGRLAGELESEDRPS